MVRREQPCCPIPLRTTWYARRAYPHQVETRLLRYFLAVAELGSVTAAAAHLHVTQPVLSRQIRVLEHHVGFSLFDRTDNRLRLSSAGQEFLPAARDVVDRAELARKAAEAIAAGSISEVVI